MKAFGHNFVIEQAPLTAQIAWDAYTTAAPMEYCIRKVQKGKVTFTSARPSTAASTHPVFIKYKAIK